MRCGPARRRLSDDLDGVLDARRRRGLEAHLASCPACRACRDALARLQAEAGRPVERAPEYWAGFEQRLASRLEGAGPGRVPVTGRRRLAWAGAGLLALAAAGGTWYALSQRERVLSASWPASEEALAPLIEEAEADPVLSREAEREVMASIESLTPVPEADAAALPVADPFFWEGLSEEELGFIASELENENERGGPQ